MGQSDPKITALETKVNSLTNLQPQVAAIEAVLKNPSKLVASNIKPDDVATSFATNVALLNKLSNDLATTQQTKIAQPLATELLKNPDYTDILISRMMNNTEFTKAVAKAFADNPEYQQRFRGQKGDAGELSTGGDVAIKSNLSSREKPRTLWCADGDVCVLPPGKRAIGLGKSYLTDTGLVVGDKLGTHSWGAYMEGNTVSANKISTNGAAYMEGGKVVADDITVGPSYVKKDSVGLGQNAFMDNDQGGRVYAKKQVQIGDWVIYQKDDGHLVFHRQNVGDIMWMNQSGQVGAMDNFYSTKRNKWIS